MTKKLISAILLTLVVLSFASARVVNFAIGPSFSYFKGVAPLSDDDPPSWAYTTKNINFGASAGLVLYF